MVFFVLFSTGPVCGQSVLRWPEARQRALAGTDMDGNIVSGNLASPADSTRLQLTSGSSRQFGLPLRNIAFSAVYRLASMQYGGGFQQWGDDLYRFRSFRVAVSWHTGPWILGGRAERQAIHIERNPVFDTFYTDFGCTYIFSTRWTGSLALTDVFHSFRPDDPMARPSMHLSFRWTPDQALRIYLTTAKTLVNPLQLVTALEYRAATWAWIRWGFKSSPPHFCGGLGIQRSRLSVDYGIEYDFLLGPVQELTLTMRWTE